MSQSLRQSELFAGADWRVIYRAFTEINFNASDPASINRALRQYIQTNYAEDFSDWVESSEFVVIIDLLSWLAGSLAFKTDINARENFLETAESRESVLRLARFLSYNPRRNQPARGLLKVVGIETNDDVYDAYGNNLSNRAIKWNDTEDQEWFDRFLLVLNSAMVSTNPFGIPLRSESISDIRAQLYRLNGLFGDQSPAFSARINGKMVNFEIFNGDFSEDAGFFERTPDLDAAMHLYYRTDGNGNASANTGFFLPFKQGTLAHADYLLSDPIENRIIDINVAGINHSDVWVQSISDAGLVQAEWTKVPAIFSDNITFNSIDNAVRNIYSVNTRADDQITIRFADGRFGAVPIGNLRVWYRVSNGLQYQIRPKDINNIRLALPYYNRRGVKKTLTVTLSLQDSVSNSAPSETDEEVRFRAPSVYATQNRMVSGEDYNTFPLQSNLAIKVKAVNRVYSGHSRFIDLNDPTGTYQDTVVFADDGMFYMENYDGLIEVPVLDNRTPEELLSLFVQPALLTREITQYMQNEYLKLISAGTITVPNNMTWHQASNADYSSTGRFTVRSGLIMPGASVRFLENGVHKWVSITNIDLDANETYSVASIRTTVSGDPGPVTLSEPISTNAVVTAIMPAYAPYLSDSALADLTVRFENTQSCFLWYDYADSTWLVASPDFTDVTSTSIKMMTLSYVGGLLWRFRSPGLRYVFESEKKVQWYYDGQRAIDGNTGIQQQDLVRVLRINEDLTNTNSKGLGREYDLAIDKMVYDSDGYADPHRICVRFRDKDEDGVSDDPDSFYRLVSMNERDQYLFWELDSYGVYRPTTGVVAFKTEAMRLASSCAVDTVAFQISGSTNNSFWIKTEAGWEYTYGTHRYAIGRGNNVAAEWYAPSDQNAPIGNPIAFKWKHYTSADRRIDPAMTNIIDIFVLTREYDYEVRQWLATGADAKSVPLVPSEIDLRMAFSEFEQYKMFSDQIVWRPVRYKFLFGASALPELRARFKVVKLPNSAMSDGEIKSRVIRAINQYFSATLWDFGETFYYTELAAYLHQQLASVIASVVLVPTQDTGRFGNGFEVRSRSDEMFLSTASVQDVTIIESNTPDNLRMYS